MVHLDIRLPNLFYVMDDGVLSIKVIDWDDSVLLGDPIPRRLLDDAGMLLYSYDRTTGSEDVHAFMVNAIRGELKI